LDRDGDWQERRRGVNVLICNRAGSPARILHALQKPCDRCGHLCWVSPASAAEIRQQGLEFEVLCIECGVPEARAAQAKGELEMLRPSEGQLAEIREHLPVADADKLMQLAESFVGKNRRHRA
jgi:hypothetical protein